MQSQDATTLDDVRAEIPEAFTTIARVIADDLDELDEALAEFETTFKRLNEQIGQPEPFVGEARANKREAPPDRTCSALNTMREHSNKLSESYGSLSRGAGTAYSDLIANILESWTDLERAWNDVEANIVPETETGD